MTRTIGTLSGYSVKDVYYVFVDAFADYVQDVSHVTEEIFRNRAVRNGVDLNLSAAVFLDGKLVGFTLVAIDQFKGQYCAYDAGTGIIKPQRGKGLAKEMFEFLTPSLKRMGIERFILEVLKENTAAVRAYRKTGFQTVRELDSYQLIFDDAKLDERPKNSIEIHTIVKSALPSFESYMDWQPSWENSLASIGRIPDEVMLIGARYEGEEAGILVYYPTQKWILCLAVKKEFRRRKIASELLAALKDSIGEDVDKVSLINVERTDHGMTHFLEKVGFTYRFDQYEMELALI